MTQNLREIAERGELAPEVELRAYWHAFCDCDPRPDDFTDRMEAAGLITFRRVTKEDLEDAFAAERGIEKGGSVWVLTDAGRAALEQGDMEGGPTAPEPDDGASAEYGAKTGSF